MTKEDVEDASGEGEQECWFGEGRCLELSEMESGSWRDCCYIPGLGMKNILKQFLIMSQSGLFSLILRRKSSIKKNLLDLICLGKTMPSVLTALLSMGNFFKIILCGKLLEYN